MFDAARARDDAHAPESSIDARARAMRGVDARGASLEIPRLDDFRDEAHALRFVRANRWLSVDMLAFPVRAMRERARARAREDARARTRARGRERARRRGISAVGVARDETNGRARDD